MTIALALLFGTLVGVGCAMIPGLHLALPLALALALGLDRLVAPLDAAVFLAASAGASLYIRRLGMIYHPSATSGDVLSLDPALRLCHEGRGADALKLSVLGTDMAWLPFLPVVVAVAVSGLLGINLVTGVDHALGIVGVPLILWWVWHTAKKSKRTMLTLLGFGLVGAYGYAVFHHPALAGSEHQIAPVLAGLFGLPLMIQVIRERADGLPDQQPARAELDVKVGLGFAGSLLGAATGFFAGLGASSLVSLAGDHAETDEDYLLLASAGESSNDVMAIFLALAAGMGRSGEAVLLNRVLPQADATAAVVLVGALLWGAWAGRKATLKLAGWYPRFIKQRKVWKLALLVIAFSLLPVFLAGGGFGPSTVVALGLTAAGLALGLWTRSCRLPAQVSFGALTIPLVLSSAGLVPVLNGLFF